MTAESDRIVRALYDSDGTARLTVSTAEVLQEVAAHLRRLSLPPRTATATELTFSPGGRVTLKIP